MSFKIYIDGKKLTVTDVLTSGYLPIITCDDRHTYYVAEDSDSAGFAAGEYWRDMAHNDKREFAAIIGEERLVQWALGEYDEFGIDSLESFLATVEGVPEELWAGYDGEELSVGERSKLESQVCNTVCSELESELGFVPTVAYRQD